MSFLSTEWREDCPESGMWGVHMTDEEKAILEAWRAERQGGMRPCAQRCCNPA
jgi:hypothetical protein